jgi:membrane protein implicated in regulation of membrane protease activity
MWPALSSLGIWNWFIIGGLLLVVEVIAPGVFMFWLGLAALAVGAISLLVNWPWQAQVIAFAVIAIALIPLWRRLAKKSEEPNDQPFLNRRAHAYVGRVFTLERPIVDGRGTVAIDDSVWRIGGSDCPAGTRVKVVGVDGSMLRVEPG